MEPNTWLRWIECHPGTTSMVQGAATLLAIAVAIFIPMMVRRREEQFEKVAYHRTLRSLLSASAITVISLLSKTLALRAEKSAARWKERREEIAYELNTFVALIDTFLSKENDNLLEPYLEAAMPQMRLVLENKKRKVIQGVQTAIDGGNADDKNADGNTLKDEVFNITSFIRHIRRKLAGPSLWERRNRFALGFAEWLNYQLTVLEWRIQGRHSQK